MVGQKGLKGKMAMRSDNKVELLNVPLGSYPKSLFAVWFVLSE